MPGPRIRHVHRRGFEGEAADGAPSRLRSQAVAACLLIGFSANVAFYGIAFVLSLYLQRVLGEPAVTAGLLFLPMTGLLTAASLASARVAARRGHRLPFRLGLSASTLGMVLLVFRRGRAGMEIALVPAGAGLGFALPSLTFLLLPLGRAGHPACSVPRVLSCRRLVLASAPRPRNQPGNGWQLGGVSRRGRDQLRIGADRQAGQGGCSAAAGA